MSICQRLCAINCVLLSMCLLDVFTPAHAQDKVTNYQTPGNLQSSQSIECGDVSTLKNTYTPPDLYAGMTQCIKKGDYAAAVYFFALAGSYSYFDGLRVTDDTAHQAHAILLQESLDSLGVTAKSAFMQQLQNTLGNHDRLPAVCRDIEHVGAPTYYPRYMVQHGMNAVLGEQTGDGLVPNFDAATGWKKALGAYLHCQNT